MTRDPVWVEPIIDLEGTDGVLGLGTIDPVGVPAVESLGKVVAEIDQKILKLGDTCPATACGGASWVPMILSCARRSSQMDACALKQSGARASQHGARLN